MTDTLPLSIQPVISYPKEAEVGKTYLMEIDLQMPESGFEWQYEEEEYLIYCMVNAGNLFTVTSVGEPAIMLHRFGGTYGSAKFLVEADIEEKNGSIAVIFVNQWGTLIRSVNCNVTLQKISLSPTIYKENISINGQCNRGDLPLTDYYGLPIIDQQFVGREKHLQELYGFISYDYTSPIIVVDGIGGVGKTTLVVEAAYRCLEYKNGYRTEKTPLPIYDVVVFVHFKPEELRLSGVIKNQEYSKNLNDIFHALTTALDDGAILRFSSGSISDQTIYVKERLRSINKKILLIIDDFQSIEDTEKENVLNFLRNLPVKVKVVITTRRGSLGVHSHVNLEQLGMDEAVQLIDNCLKYSVPSVEITQSEKEMIIECYSALPLAITYSVGQIANGYTVDNILGTKCPTNKDEIAKFCFDNSVQLLKEHGSQLLLKAISLFVYAPLKQSAIEVSGLIHKTDEVVIDAFAELKRCALVHTDNNDRCLLLPITRHYALSLLKKSQDEYNLMINLRYKYHLNIAKQYGGSNDSGAWWLSYSNIRREWSNLIAELEYCTENSQYERAKDLWNCLNHFADLSGFWTERLHYLNWIIDRAKLEEDLETYVKSIFRKIWTLTMQATEESYVQAENLLEEGLKGLKRIDTLSPELLKLKDYAFHNSVVLLTRINQYDRAQEMLIKKNEALDKLSKDPDLKPEFIQRCRINSLRDEAKIDLKQGNLQEAKEKYLTVKNMSAEINWKRIECYAKNELADICITQSQFSEAEEYLLSGIQTAINNRNNRRYACYQKSFAKLYSKQGRISESYKAASLARAMFKKIGMISELNDMTNLFQLNVEDISYANLPKEFEVIGE